MALAVTMSVCALLPVMLYPLYSIVMETFPCASVVPLIDLTSYPITLALELTIFSIALNDEN